MNQDAYLTNPNLLNLRHCHFFSVCDGHGHYGQEVSGLLKHRLPFNVEHGLQQAGFHVPSEEGKPLDYPDFNKLHKTMTTAFADTNREVYGMVTDVRFSGSTCVSVLTFGRKIYVSNVGDSRAILIKAPNS